MNGICAVSGANVVFLAHGQEDGRKSSGASCVENVKTQERPLESIKECAMINCTIYDDKSTLRASCWLIRKDGE